MPVTRRYSVAAIVVLTISAGCTAPHRDPPVDPPPEWDRELPAGVHIEGGEDDSTHRVVRVVDAATGLPVAGARLDNRGEAWFPGAEPWEDYHFQSLVTDGDGYVPAGLDGGNWWFIEADGYASVGDMHLESEYALEPGVDRVLEVRDWRDRPLPGIVVEVLLGCGHTAAVRSEVTDAGGRVLLRSLQPWGESLWLRGSGVAGDSRGYGGGSFERQRHDGDVLVLNAMPSLPVEGRVVDLEGKPVAGAFVGTKGNDRGPWARTDAEGAFRLEGAPIRGILEATFWVEGGEGEDGEAAATELLTAPGVRPVIRLPLHGENHTGPWRVADSSTLREEVYEVAVTLGTKHSGETPARARLVAVRQGDGLVVQEAAEVTKGTGARTLALPEGDWTVTAGSRAGAFRPQTRSVKVDRDSTASLRYSLEPNPVCHPRLFVSSATGESMKQPEIISGRFHVVTEEGHEEASTTAIPGEIHVPAEGPFAIEFDPEDSDLLFGRVVLDRVPRDRGPDIPLVRLSREEPAPSAAGAPLLRSRLIILRPDGSPFESGRLDVRTPDSKSNSPPQWISIPEGGELDVSLRLGQVVTVVPYAADELEPLTFTVEGPGPWTVEWPETGIEILAKDASGAPLDFFHVLPMGRGIVYGENGRARLWRTTPGPLRLWITSEGFRQRDLRVVVRKEEVRRVEVTLARE